MAALYVGPLIKNQGSQGDSWEKKLTSTEWASSTCLLTAFFITGALSRHLCRSKIASPPVPISRSSSIYFRPRPHHQSPDLVIFGFLTNQRTCSPLLVYQCRSVPLLPCRMDSQHNRKIYPDALRGYTFIAFRDTPSVALMQCLSICGWCFPTVQTHLEVMSVFSPPC